jgi:hypothetical protein
VTRRIAVGVAWALAGLAIAGGLMAGAFALAGDEIGRPATPTLPSERPAHDTDDRTRSPEPTPSESPSTDDHGGDHAGNGDGAVDDHGGSGSDDSGSDRGSGSDGSGSGPGSGSDDSGSSGGDD